MALAALISAAPAAPAATAASQAPATAPAVAHADTTRIERFSLVVHRGERFERRMLGGLRFRLEPLDAGAGWSIRMYAADTTQDFAGIATPPYHGVNHTEIEAWHFRNADNSGPNDGDVNAPQEERWFQFVTTRRDYATFASALDVALWPGDRPRSAVDSAFAVMDSIPTGEGKLVIREKQLGNLGAGRVPRFESMRCDVTLTPPRAGPGR